jgi:hypothetical protein
MPTPIPVPVATPMQLSWLAANAPAVQAGAALVQAFAAIAALGVTAWLAWLTRQYVRQTRELVAAGGREELSQRRHLWAIVKMLRWLLDNLPSEPGDQAARRVHEATMWAEDDVRALVEVSARAVGPGESIVASSVANRLRGIRDRVAKVKASGREYNWNKFDWQLWADDIATAKDGLAQLFVAAAGGGAAKDTKDGR